MPGLDIANIRKTFGEVVAVDNISLSINEGELFFLLGPSGCGKTTLLRIIAGFTEPDAGTIGFAGNNLLNTPVEKRNIGMVFQNYSLWPHMTVLENVAYGMKMRNVARDEITKRAKAALEMVDMRGLEQRKPGALSGGQQQRIALARALVYEPSLLLLDEPLSNLDAKLRKDMRNEIRKLHRRLGITMVYVTHDQEESAALADRIALLIDGRVVQVGTPQDIYRNPQSRYAAEFFGRANIFPVTVSEICEHTARLLFGKQAIQATAPEKAPPAKGASVAALVRPESISFASQGDGANILRGKLLSHEFSGPVENFTVDIDGTQVLMMSVYAPHEHERPAIGQEIAISFPPEAVHLIAESKGQ
jgi:spermidine/putrescine ABC transporter ATP-binding subunit